MLTGVRRLVQDPQTVLVGVWSGGPGWLNG